MTIQHVPGTDSGRVMLYALSTCGWCQKTRTLLEKIGIAYDYEYIDQLKGEEQKKVINDLEKWNQNCSFPTLVINDKKCIVGFQEDEIRKALKK